MIEYYGDQLMDDVFERMLKTHPDLRPLYEADIVFRICAVRKTNKDEEPEPMPGEPVKVKRISKEDAPFIEGHYKVYVDAVRWEDANEEQQEAYIHAALCSVGIEHGQDGGIKLVAVKPDAVVYQKNLAWYGSYNENLINLRNNLQSGKKGCVLTGPTEPTEPTEPPAQTPTDSDAADGGDGMTSDETEKPPAPKPKAKKKRSAKPVNS